MSKEETNLYKRCANIFKAHGVDIGGSAEEIIIKATEVERGTWEINETTLPTTNLSVKDKDKIYFELEPYNSLGDKYLCKATSFDISDNNLRGAIGLCSAPSNGDVKIYKTILSYSSDLHNYYAFVETYNLSNQT